MKGLKPGDLAGWDYPDTEEGRILTCQNAFATKFTKLD